MLPKSVEAWLVELGSNRILPESSGGSGGNEVVVNGLSCLVVQTKGLVTNTTEKMKKMEVVLNMAQRKRETAGNILKERDEGKEA